MITWDTAVKNALAMFHHRDEYCYFYGAKGQKLTDSVMEELWEAEPAYFARYSTEQKKAIFDFSRNRIGYDCSGYIGAVTGCNTYSRAQWAKCDHKTDKYNGVAGSIVYTTFGGKGSHIGIDIGYGFSLSVDREGESINLRRHSENTIAWEGSGQLSGYIDYTGADSR